MREIHAKEEGAETPGDTDEQPAARRRRARSNRRGETRRPRRGARRHCRRRRTSQLAVCRIFTANIRNPHTRRACARFFNWCARRRLGITDIRPLHVAAYIERLHGEAAAPSVKQELAAIRMLFDWLVIGQVLPMNPAAAVRGPTHVVKSGKTPVLDGSEWRRLVDAIPIDTVRDRRDRALIATLTYSFARISAALKMKVEDLRARRRLGAAPARERRQAACHSLPPRSGRGAAVYIAAGPASARSAKADYSAPPRAGRLRCFPISR